MANTLSEERSIQVFGLWKPRTRKEWTIIAVKNMQVLDINTAKSDQLTENISIVASILPSGLSTREKTCFWPVASDLLPLAVSKCCQKSSSFPIHRIGQKFLQ